MDYTSKFVGIDVASTKLDVCWDTTQGLAHQTILYDEQSLNDFLTEHPELVVGQSIMGVESTGEYHLKVAKYFLNLGFTVKVINPIITKEYTRATIRGKKTDKTDSQLIHKALSEGHGDVVNLSQLTNESKELLRLSASLNVIVHQLGQRIQSTERKELSGLEEIQRQLYDILDELKDTNERIVAKATEERSDEELYIDSIPGFAVKLSAVTHHEIGDINRFKNFKSLVAFAGLDPKIKQSGNNLNVTGRLTKRGSSHLRAGLFLAANSARQCDQDLNNYYLKKKSEGRSYTEIMCMISRKLLARIYTVLKEQRMYQPRPIIKELSTDDDLTEA